MVALSKNKIGCGIMLVLCIIMLMISGCGGSNETDKDIEAVLDRNIFVFKDKGAHVYASVKGIETTKPYSEDWDFRKIFNDKNFKDITWKTEDMSDDGDGSLRKVVFKGVYIKNPDNPDVFASFYVGEKTKPVAVALKIVPKGKNPTEINRDKFDNISDSAAKTVLTDAAISIMLSVMGDIDKHKYW